jgi:putative sigma-54 modulation protein
MRTEIIGRNVQVDDRLRQLVEQKLAKLQKFLDEPLEVRVTLLLEKHSHVAELHVTHHDGVLQATEGADGNFQEAVRRAVAKVEQAARRTHGKRVDKRHGALDRVDRGRRWPVEVLDPESVGDGRAPRVIETVYLDIKPMAIEEAALELDGSEQAFIVFRDSASDRLSVLYKRKDQNYGLIAPEL